MKTQKEIMHEGEFVMKLTIMRMHEAIPNTFHTNITAASHNFSFRHKPQILDSSFSNLLFSHSLEINTNFFNLLQFFQPEPC